MIQAVARRCTAVAMRRLHIPHPPLGDPDVGVLRRRVTEADAHVGLA